MSNTTVVWGRVGIHLDTNALASNTGLFYFLPRPGVDMKQCFLNTPYAGEIAALTLMNCLSTNPDTFQDISLHSGSSTIVNLRLTKYDFLDSSKDYVVYDTLSSVEMGVTLEGFSDYGFLYFTVRYPTINIQKEEYSVTPFNLFVNILLTLSASFSGWKTAATLSTFLYRCYVRRQDRLRLRRSLHWEEGHPMLSVPPSKDSPPSQLLHQPLLSTTSPP